MWVYIGLLGGCFSYIVILGYSSSPHRVKFGRETVVNRVFGEVPCDGRPAAGLALGEQFRVSTFNVLAQSLARSDMHSHVEKGLLKAKTRLPQVCEEVLRYDADVINLQEVDMLDYLEPLMKNAGYDLAIFQKKGGGKADGCATFVKTSKFDVLEIQGVKYGLTLMDGVGTFVAVRSKAFPDSRTVVIANTHLFWKPQHESVRLRQLRCLLRAAEMFWRPSHAYGQFTPPALVMTGDLNSMRGAPVLSVLSGETVDIPAAVRPGGSGGSRRYGRDLPSVKGDENHNDSETNGRARALPEKLSLWPSLIARGGLASAYDRYGEAFAGNDGGVFTIYDPNFSEEIDYIHYSPESLRLMRLLEMPTVEQVAAEVALPSRYYPSDHLALCADFRLLNE